MVSAWLSSFFDSISFKLMIYHTTQMEEFISFYCSNEQGNR